MAKQTIDIPAVESVTSDLQSCSSQIQSAYGSMNRTVDSCLSGWTGSAGDQARSRVHAVFQMEEGRETVLKNYVAMLRQQVTPGYRTAEETNRSLAELFL